MTKQARLAERPDLKATTWRVEDLVRDVAAGKLTTPFFQRGLKWEGEDRLALFDSILRGFPIGNLLVQRRAVTESEPIRLGMIKGQSSAGGNVLEIVDGQQRVHSIASEALGQRLENQQPIYYDLERHELGTVPRGRREHPGHWLLLTTAMDSGKLIDWLVEAQLPKATREEAIAVGKRLREYDVPVYFLEATSSTIAREIFKRTNRRGHELTEAEVFDSVYAKKGAAGKNSIAGIARALERRGFGHLEDHESIRRALVAVIGKDPLRATAEDVDEKSVRTALSRTREALERSVDLVSEAGFPHVRLLPYSLTLVMLAAFFDRFPEVEDRTRTLLRRWVWRGALNGLHRGDLAPIRKALQIIRTNDESEAASRLALQMATTKATIGASAARLPIRTNHAQSRVLIAALFTLDPHDMGDDLVAPSELFGAAGTVGTRLSASTSVLGSSLANRILLPVTEHPSVEALSEMPDEWLSKHALDREVLIFLEQGRDELALERRARRLENTLDRVLESHAEWTQNDRPSLRSLRTRAERVEGDAE